MVILEQVCLMNCKLILYIYFSFVSFYNTVFTFLPVVIRAIFDEDVFYTSKRKETILGSKRIKEGEEENDILR